MIFSSIGIITRPAEIHYKILLVCDCSGLGGSPKASQPSMCMLSFRSGVLSPTDRLFRQEFAAPLALSPLQSPLLCPRNPLQNLLPV